MNSHSCQSGKVGGQDPLEVVGLCLCPPLELPPWILAASYTHIFLFYIDISFAVLLLLMLTTEEINIVRSMKYKGKYV